MTDIKIMIVEDEAIVAEDIKHMLKSMDYQVPAVVSTANEAIQKAEETRPNLVLMDIMLKGKSDGIEAAQVIHKKWGTPIIYLTAYADEPTLQRAKLTQPYGYIIKPFEKKELKTNIEIALYKYNMEKKLKESEKKYRTLFEDSGDAMFMSDKDGNFIDINQSSIELFGYTKAEMLNMNLSNLYEDPTNKEIIMNEIEKYTQIRNYEIGMKKKNGQLISCLMTITLNHGNNLQKEPNLQGIIRDITERKIKENALKRKAENLDKRFKELQCLYSISNLVETPDIELKDIIQETVSLIPKALSYPNIVGVKLNIDKDIYKTDNFKETEWKEERDINVRGNKIGDLKISYIENSSLDKNKIFLKEEKILFSVIAERLGKIIEQIKIEEELKESLEKQRRVMEDVIQAMSNTTELRDAYTAGHQKRVSRLSVAIAKKMDLPMDEIEGIRLASIIHDIGKIAVPAEILTKPGKISNIEFELIKIHPQIGYEILKTIEFPWPIADIVLQHHERIDGSGYPQNLSGNNIRREARILTVADVIDAMASHRPYRPALGIEEAINEIKKNRNIFYDKDVVDACLELYEKQEYDFDVYK